MIQKKSWRQLCVAVMLALGILCMTSQVRGQARPETPPGRNPSQPVDEAYTAKIKKYTTETFFLSPLVDYLPASKTVPTPEAVLGDVAGAPGILPYPEEIYKYMRMLEKASPRVKVYSIGKTEEGREMIAVAVSSEANLAKLEENRARLAKLADPRSIQMNDAEADKLVEASTPVYYITGTIHSPETGSPTALMELTYRLAVDESQYVREIRDGLVTLITPVVEVDGRARMVDIYRWHLAHPKENYPPLIYWGKYVAHDNNRDAMNITLKLTENVLNTMVTWKAQVLHDLHESVPYLYDNTAGDGPFNAWVDPILTNEWEMLGWRNVADLTRMGMPGVFTHGRFDTWSPGYLMFLAAMHNGVSRLYETFGNGGADTIERTLGAGEYSRTWYRQDPPLPKVMWSQRNNNNYQQTGLLTALHYFSENQKHFMRNFYLKSKRSVQKPSKEGPAAYVFPADDPRLGPQAELLRILQKQHVEISRAKAAFTVTLPPPPAPRGGRAAGETRPADAQRPAEGRREPPAPKTREIPAGSYVVRMDQPYSRSADALLDYQYWNPDDPQRNPYDDTGWTLGELFNVQVVRATDAKVLDVAMERVTDLRAPGGVTGSGALFAVNHNTDPALATLRYRFPKAQMDAAEEPFEAAGRKFNRGSFLIRDVNATELETAARELGLQAYALEAAPSVKTHPLRAARIAFLHTWLSTQTEGWWRLALDKLQIPFSYISTQTIAREADLNAKYDVILFPPAGSGGNPLAIVQGLPTSWGNPLPWKHTPETPNLVGGTDSTDDMRPGLGWDGLTKLQQFVQKGGLLVTVADTTNFATTLGFTPGVGITAAQRLRVVGSIVRTRTVDSASPIAYGYGDQLSSMCDNGPIFTISNFTGRGRFGGRFGGPPSRATGRGTQADQDFTVGRPPVTIPELPEVHPWETPPVTDEQRRNNSGLIPPELRPRVVFRYSEARDFLISGLAENHSEITERPNVIDSPLGKGHVVLFSTNPIYRGGTQGSYFQVFNAILNFDNLHAGRKLAEK